MGGDEFVIINGDADSSIKDYEEKINRNLRILLERQHCPYTVSVSAGYALKDEGVKNVPDLIELADSRLYQRKAMKKSGENHVLH